MTEDKKVTIGGQEYTIQRFRGLKAILAIAVMTRIARDVPDILSDSTKAFYKRNTIIVTEAMAKLPRWEGFSKADFDEAEDKTGSREIELPAPITQREQVMSSLPALLENARTEVIRLFAILVIPNAELMAADKADDVNSALDKYRDLFLYEAEIDELADVTLAAQEAVSEQLGKDKRDRLGKLFRSLMVAMNLNQSQTPPALPSIEIPVTTTDSTQVMSPDGAPTSSTDSQQPTGGPETTRSLVSPGLS